jgi:hypothetical protein
MPNTARTALMCLIAVVGTSSALAGQDDPYLPDDRHFRTPIADPAGARLGTGLMRTDLLRAPGEERVPFQLPAGQSARDDVVATVALGAVFPLLRLATWDRGSAVLVTEAKVFGRFRVERPARDDMGQDWYIAGGVDARHGAWSGRTQLSHRSSHLGDEFSANTGAQRIEFGGEQLDVLAAYDVAAAGRLYAGGSWIFRSYLNWDDRLRDLGIQDRGIVQIGGDRVWRPWQDQRFGVYAGIDWQAAERTDWRGALALALGLGVGTGRSLRLMARYYDGPSTMGQFFLTNERSFALELAGEF